jgi:hypothetical protein
LNTNKIRRGSCPRCNGRKIQHHIAGMPDFSAFVDAEDNIPEWINFSGCVIGPGPHYDRSCDACGLRWNSWSEPRAIYSTWRDVRDEMGVETNGQAVRWLEEHIAPMTLIDPFPRLDDPRAKIDIWNGITHKTLRFPFTHAEWESTLLDVSDDATARLHGVRSWPVAESSAAVDNNRAVPLGNPPTDWASMPISRPRGNGCYTGRRRVLVRGFDTAHSRYADLDGEDRFVIDDARVNHDPQHPIHRGDVVFLNGQFKGDDETSLCAPGRVVMVGPCPSRTHVRVWSLIDEAQVVPAHGDEALTIFRSLLPAADRELVADLALKGRPATAPESVQLMALFGVAMPT